MVKELDIERNHVKRCIISRKDIQKLTDTTSEHPDDFVLTISNLEYNRDNSDKKKRPKTSDECLDGRFQLVGDLRTILEGRKAEKIIRRELIRPEESYGAGVEKWNRETDRRRRRSASNNCCAVRILSDKMSPIANSDYILKMDQEVQKDFPIEEDVVTIYLENKKVQTNKIATSELNSSQNTNIANATNNSIIDGQTRRLKYVLSHKPSQESTGEPPKDQKTPKSPSGIVATKIVEQILAPFQPQSQLNPNDKPREKGAERASRSMEKVPRSPARPPRSPTRSPRLPRSERNTWDGSFTQEPKQSFQKKRTSDQGSSILSRNGDRKGQYKEYMLTQGRRYLGRTSWQRRHSPDSTDSVYYYEPWSYISDRDRERRFSRTIERSYGVDPYDVRVLQQILHSPPGAMRQPPPEIVHLVQCCENNYLLPRNVCCNQRPMSPSCFDCCCCCQPCQGTEVYRVIKCNGY